MGTCIAAVEVVGGIGQGDILQGHCAVVQGGVLEQGVEACRGGQSWTGQGVGIVPGAATIDRDILSQVDLCVVDDGHAFKVQQRAGLVAVGGGVVLYLAVAAAVGVQVGLQQGVAGGVGLRHTRCQRSQGFTQAGQVVHHADVGEGHAADVGHGEAVVQHVACKVGQRVFIAPGHTHKVLVKGDADAAEDRDGFGVTAGQGLRAVGDDAVVDAAVPAAVRVQIGLGQGVADVVDLHRVGGQGHAGVIQPHQAFGQGDIGQRDVAGVGQHDLVVQLVAHGIGEAIAVATGHVHKRFVDKQDGHGQQLHRFAVDDRRGLVRVGHRGVVQTAVAATVVVQVGLQQGVAGVVAGTGAGGQIGHALAQTGQFVGDRDARQGNGARVVDADRVLDDLARRIGKQVVVATGDAGDVLFNAQTHGAQQGGGFGVTQGHGLVRVGCGRVVDVAIALAVVVQVGLCEHIAGGVDLTFAGGQGHARDVQAAVRIDHAHVGQGQHAQVAHRDGVVQGIAHSIRHRVVVAACDVDQAFVDGQGRAHEKLDGFGVADRRGLQAVGGGGVFDVSIAATVGVQVVLRQGVAGQVGLARARGQGHARDGQARHGVVHGDLVERLVAGVGDSDRVTDDVVDRIDASVAIAASHAGDGLVDGERRGLQDGHRGIIGVRSGLVGVGGGCVHDVGAGIDLGLGHGVAGGVVPGLTHVEFAVGRGCVADQKQVGDERICHAHTGQGLVAHVLHCDAVADDLASIVRCVAWNGGILDDVQRGILIDRDGSIIGVRSGLVGVGGGCVHDVGAGIDLGLGHGVAGGVVPGFAHIEFTVGRGRIGHQLQVADERVCHGHAGQGLVSGVFNRDGVVDDFTGVVGVNTVHGRILDDVQARLELHIAEIHIHLFRVEGCDQDRCRVGCGLLPARLLNFTNDVGVVVDVGPVGVRDHRQDILAVGVGQGEVFTFVPQAIVVLVQEYFPVGQAHFVVCRAQRVVRAVGVAHAVAIHIAELRAADFAHDDGRGGQLDGGGATATNVHGGLQGAAGPGVGAIGHALALVGHIARRGNQQAVLDFGTARSGSGPGVSEGDGDFAVERAARAAEVAHAADGGDVGIDGVEAALHAAAIGEAAVGLCIATGEAAGVATRVGRCHVNEPARVGVGLVVVVGHVERIALAVDQRSVVAGLVEVDVGDHFSFKVI